MWVQATWHSPPGHSAPATQRPAGIRSRSIYGLIAYLYQIAERIRSDPLEPSEPAPRPWSGTARRDEAYGLPHEATGWALWALRFVGYLSTVPESDDPYLVFTNAIEEPVGLDIDFAVGKLRKLHDDRTRLGETREPLERFCRLLLEPPGRGAIVSPDRFDSGEKLHPRRWSEKHIHVQPSDKRASASASTSSRECPTPAAISFSPRASKSRSSRAASDRS